MTHIYIIPYGFLQGNLQVHSISHSSLQHHRVLQSLVGQERLLSRTSPKIALKETIGDDINMGHALIPR